VYDCSVGGSKETLISPIENGSYLAVYNSEGIEGPVARGFIKWRKPARLLVLSTRLDINELC
jgi:hypothetical protein